MLTKVPEMLQPDAFCEHTMQQNATTAAGAPPRPCWGSLQRSPGPRVLSGEWERERRGGEGNSDAQLEQGRRLAKAGPV